MKTNIKQYEAWCLEYAELWNKPSAWEYYCLVKDAWLAGYRKGRIDVVDTGENIVEVSLAGNQIGSKNETK